MVNVVERYLSELVERPRGRGQPLPVCTRRQSIQSGTEGTNTMKAVIVILSAAMLAIGATESAASASPSGTGNACVVSQGSFSQAAEASPRSNQAYADALCVELQHAYGARVNGWKIKFKASRPANFDPVAHVQLYWIWYSVVHRGRVSLNVAKVSPDATPVEGPYSLSIDQYEHLKTPAAIT
jgi:hypothetical protein